MFAYVQNRAANRVDPSGKAPFWDHFRDGYNLARNADGGAWSGIVRGWDEMMVDFGEYTDYEAIHATTFDREQSAAAVMASAQALVDTGMLNGVKVPQAVIDHARLDLKTPAHMGSYYGGMDDPVGSITHLITESVDSIKGRNGVTARCPN